MDILTLRPYQRQLSKRTSSFLEFFINDKPLSELIDNCSTSVDSFLENYVGVLGNINACKIEVVKLKQLLGKSISDNELREVFPDNFTEEEYENCIFRYRDELADPEIIIYECAECGDYDCGGVKVIIEKGDNTVKWNLVDEPELRSFLFDKYAYYETLGARLKKLTAAY